MTAVDCDAVFQRLTGCTPNRWQRRLLADWLMRGVVPAALDLPTGLGKTSVMALWLVARAAGAPVARRLVYVVDRRAVVDQATDEANRLAGNADAILGPAGLAVSTLRGRHADNRRWLEDPTVPAIVVGTVDMIGSRLLFEGYGVSRRMRPYHAGLLGADTLFVLDEAHLCPPFEALLRAVEAGEPFRGADPALAGAVPPVRLLSLSATGRGGADGVFELEDGDRDDWTARRLDARKRLTIDDGVTGKSLVDPLADRAWSLGEGNARVIVYCHGRDDARKIADTLAVRGGKTGRPDVALLTGARRVHERDALAERLKALGFLRDGPAPETRDRPAFLVATAAGEVGIDLDADHMVCDLVAAERMIQRLGRVNRSGGDGRVAHIAVLVPPAMDGAERGRLTAPLRALPLRDGGAFDASPGAILTLRRTHAAVIADATTPAPLHPPLTRATVEAWSLTGLDEHPGRPAPGPWLRGWIEDEEPTATVLWRRWLPWRDDEAEPRGDAVEAFFEAAPPHLAELLEAPVDAVRATLAARAKAVGTKAVGANADAPAVIVLSPARAFKRAFTMGELAALGRKGRDIAPGDVVVVSAGLGGLSGTGHLDAAAGGMATGLDHGWDEATLAAIGTRIVGPGEALPEAADWKAAHRFARQDPDKRPDGEADPDLRVFTLRRGGAARRGDPAIARRPQRLDEHQEDTAEEAGRIARALWADAPADRRAAWTRLLTAAARFHDEGKARRAWQQAMAAPPDGGPWAKTAGIGNPRRLNGYRHEVGSLFDAEARIAALDLAPAEADLLRHLILAHHGGARPAIHPYDPDHPPADCDALAQAAARRFARLTRALGPWGLAWWEALLRAADQTASRRNDEKDAR